MNLDGIGLFVKDMATMVGESFSLIKNTNAQQ